MIKRVVDRRAQERDRPCLEHVQQDDEHQRPRKLHEEEKLKREESTRKKDSEDRGRQEVQDKLGRFFPQHHEPAKPAVHAPWSTAGTRGQNVLENKSSAFSHPSEKFPYVIRPYPRYINRGDNVRLLFWDSAAVRSVGSLGLFNSATTMPTCGCHYPGLRTLLQMTVRAFHYQASLRHLGSIRGPNVAAASPVLQLFSLGIPGLFQEQEVIPLWRACTDGTHCLQSALRETVVFTF